jgi:hypothetical protein
MIDQVNHFVDEADCNYAIESIESFLPIMTDVTPGSLRLFESSEPKFLYFAEKYTNKVKDYLNKDFYLHSSIMIKYEKGVGMGTHSDVMDDRCKDCTYSMVIYFNDDYEGGEIYFPNQNPEIIISPKTGDAVIYPTAGYEYWHGVKGIENGKRYSMAFCFTTNKALIKPVYRDAIYKNI